jgi:hypothetical protein
MFEYYLCKEITDHKKWLSRLKYSMHKGLVFRLREVPDEDKWRPGIMEQDGSRWVWKEKSIEELRAYDIHLSKVRHRLILSVRGTQSICQGPAAD